MNKPVTPVRGTWNSTGQSSVANKNLAIQKLRPPEGATGQTSNQPGRDSYSGLTSPVGDKISKISSSQSRNRLKSNRQANNNNIFEALVELRPNTSTKAERLYEDAYKHLQTQLAKSHRKSQKLNLIRHQESNCNPFLPTIAQPSPSQTLEAEHRKNEALLEIYTDSGTFSKVVAMTVAASVLDTKLPCDVVQYPLDMRKREELYRFCHDVSAILGIHDGKSIDADDFRRLWHLFSIFTNALDQQQQDSNGKNGNNASSSNINGRLGRVVPLEDTVSDTDLVESIKTVNPPLYNALCDPLKRFLIVYGRYIEAGHVTKSFNLRLNSLNEHIKQYRERIATKPRVGITSARRPDSPLPEKVPAQAHPIQSLKILQNLSPTTHSRSAKLTILESGETPSVENLDLIDEVAKHHEDPEFGSNPLLDKIRKTNDGHPTLKKKEDTSWVQAYHKYEHETLGELGEGLKVRGQAMPSPNTTTLESSDLGNIIINNDSSPKIPSPRNKKSNRKKKCRTQSESSASVKTLLRLYRRKGSTEASSPDIPRGSPKNDSGVVSAEPPLNLIVSQLRKRIAESPAGTVAPFRKSRRKNCGSKRRSLRSSNCTNSSTSATKSVTSQKEELIIKRVPTATSRTSSQFNRSRVLCGEAIFRGIIPKPRGDIPGLCPARCKTICLEGCRYDVVRRIALENGFKEVGEHDVWNVIWTDVPISLEKALEMRRFQNAHIIFWGTCPPVQKANHFPGMNEICRKDRLARNLNRMKKTFPDDYNFFPRTWSLPADVADLLMYSRLKKNATYICKPDSGCQGKGIFLARNLKKLNPFAKLICQVYVPRPLLIDGYKFDLRIYILVTCCDPLRVFIYNEGIARFATVKYNPPNDSNIDIIYMHLTNYSLNKFSQSYDTHGDGSKRKMSTVLKTLEEGGCDIGKLKDGIDAVIVKTMIAAQPTLRHYYRASFPKHEYGSACFEILGFDILIDHNLKPFLLEVNHSPSFNLDLPVDAEIKEALLKDTFNIIYLGTPTSSPKFRKAKAKKSAPGISQSESALRISKALQLQCSHEKANSGNYRLIYPLDNGNDYGEFFHQVSNPAMLMDPSQGMRIRNKTEQMCSKSKSGVY